MDDIKAIEQLIYRSFSIGKDKDLSLINRLHASNASKFSDTPPYHLLDYNELCLHEELFFANVSDYEFNIEDLRIEVFDDMALALFIVEQKGMVVDDYSFTGRTLNIRSRVTMVFKKYNGEWLILHEHLSKFE